MLETLTEVLVLCWMTVCVPVLKTVDYFVMPLRRIDWGYALYERLGR